MGAKKTAAEETEETEEIVEKEEKGKKGKINSILELPGIGPQSAEKLMQAGYKTLESIAVASPMELVEVAALGEVTAAKAIGAARESLEMGFESADKIAKRRESIGRIATGSKELDALIGGGIETQSITEVYGQYASGKCVSKDTKILYFNPDVCHLKTIEELYNNYAINEREFDGGHIAELKHPIQVIGIDFNGNKRTAIASNLFKQKVKGLTKIVTERGSKLELTEQHPLLTIAEEGIQWKSSGLLSEGDYIGTPTEIDFEGKGELSESDAYFLGLFVAEGCANPLSITIFDEKIQTWLSKYIESKFGYKPRLVKERNLVIFQKPTKEFLGALAECKAETKFVPEQILASKKELVEWFLAGYIEGDGCLGKSITTDTKSKRLNEEMGYLLSRIGVQTTYGEKKAKGKTYHRNFITDSKGKKIIEKMMNEKSITKKKKCTGNREVTKYRVPLQHAEKIFKRTYAKLSGSRRQTNKWGKKEFFSQKKWFWQSLLSAKARKEHAKEETIMEIVQFFETRIKEIVGQAKELKAPTPQKVLAALKILPFQTKEIAKRIGMKKNSVENYFIRHMSQENSEKIAKALEEMISERLDNNLQKDISTLKILASGNIKWEKIIEIKKKKYDGWVYDLVVPEIHSFIGGNKPVFLHNTQWAFQLSVMTQLPQEEGGLSGNVLYIDSENSFRPERIIQIAKARGIDADKALKNIFVARAYNADHQMLLAEKAVEIIKEKNIKLVIVDSLTSQFRSEFIGRGMLADRQQKLNKHMHTLMKLAEMENIAVLVTNQVMSRPDIMFGDPTAPIGGNIVGHNSKTRIYLRKAKENKRVAKLVDSPSLPDGEAIYALSEKGIEDA